MVDFTSSTAIQVPVRRRENAVCCLSCSETFHPAKWALGKAAVALCEGKKEEGEEGRAEGLLPGPMCSTGQLAGAGCHPFAWLLPEVSKPSCHQQLMELAVRVRKPGIKKPNAKGREQTYMAAACYSNILLPV